MTCASSSGPSMGSGGRRRTWPPLLCRQFSAPKSVDEAVAAYEGKTVVLVTSMGDRDGPQSSPSLEVTVDVDDEMHPAGRAVGNPQRAAPVSRYLDDRVVRPRLSRPEGDRARPGAVLTRIQLEGHVR